MEVSMKIAGDIVVKMIEHGCFDNLLTENSEDGVLSKNELMVMQICKAYKVLFETLLSLESSGLDVVGQLYLGENQV